MPTPTIPAPQYHFSRVEGADFEDDIDGMKDDAVMEHSGTRTLEPQSLPDREIFRDSTGKDWPVRRTDRDDNGLVIPQHPDVVYAFGKKEARVENWKGVVALQKKYEAAPPVPKARLSGKKSGQVLRDPTKYPDVARQYAHHPEVYSRLGKNGRVVSRPDLAFRTADYLAYGEDKYRSHLAVAKEQGAETSALIAQAEENGNIRPDSPATTEIKAKIDFYSKSAIAALKKLKENPLFQELTFTPFADGYLTFSLKCGVVKRHPGEKAFTFDRLGHKISMTPEEIQKYYADIQKQVKQIITAMIVVSNITPRAGTKPGSVMDKKTLETVVRNASETEFSLDQEIRDNKEVVEASEEIRLLETTRSSKGRDINLQLPEISSPDIRIQMPSEAFKPATQNGINYLPMFFQAALASK